MINQEHRILDIIQKKLEKGKKKLLSDKEIKILEQILMAMILVIIS